ncbi:isoprenyl transferase [Anaerocolumna xylanovorans]|uniref:Isoprenyl transferase n=1 Tax=Anaerocolumna xylanovorans DSM 12503 TaxID=1121345 RepID=A0A1M7YCG0_9FIRM|nr:isoprenyl transferase [Anaerocolumna xylanovorans]SHO50269.1 undecaprenyl diphosphate synthase [Anaerocolumna xylanovorans DSM 12503]
MGEKVSDRNVPRHVAIILDGNGRWAKKRMMPRNYGHVQGSKTVENICEEAYNMGVEYLTVYAFSTENWKRPQDEVDALMKLLRSYLKNCQKTSSKNNMKVRVLGEIDGLSEDIQRSINELEEISASNTGLHFQVALNYGGRDEILRAAKKLAEDYKDGKVNLTEISMDSFSGYLDTEGIPDPDLMIRTSGEKRISNFLLWQLAYTEFYFTDTLWPDFNKEELRKAIEYYASRKRKFGGIDE